MAKSGRQVYKTILFILVFTLSSGTNVDLDVGFIIDGSGSVTEYNWNLLHDFLINLVKRLPQQGTQVGVVVFSDYGEVRIRLNTFSDLSSVIPAISRLTYPGSFTNISGGLYIARTKLFNGQNGDRPNASNLAILITDVNDPAQLDKEKTIVNAQDLHKDGITVICIGIGNDANDHELRNISSPPHTRDLNYYFVEDFNSLRRSSDKLIDIINKLTSEKTTPGASITTDYHVVPADDMESPGINLIVIIMPIISCIIVIIVIIVIIICTRKRSPGKRDDPIHEVASNSKDACLYDNQTSKKGEPTSDSKSSMNSEDKHPTTPMYDEAAPAILYDDATSVATITRPKPQPGLASYETVGVHPQYPDTYDQVHHPISDTYDQVHMHPSESCTYDNVDEAEGPDKEKGLGDQKRASNLYASVQRRASLIYAQVQKKKSYIYAQVNKRRK